MKKLVHLLGAVLVVSLLSTASVFAQCAEVGGTVEELSSVLIDAGATFCNDVIDDTGTCDCPPGYIAVGYEGFQGNQWGPPVLSQFSLRCRELNIDGTLGNMVSVTCASGSVAGASFTGVSDAAGGEALVGFQINIGCAVDGIRGQSKSIADILAGDDNSNSNAMAAIGGMGGSAEPVMYVPDGHAIVGLHAFEDAATNLSGGVAWRYAALNEIACAPTCSITDISVSNVSGCDNNGTDDVATDDFFTADVTVSFENAPMSGDLNLFGDGVASVSAASLGANAYTFSGVEMAANGGLIQLTAQFSAEPDCRRNVNAGAAPDYCSPDAPIPAGIPTMSEWGLILFGLIMFTFCVVFGFQFQRSVSMSGGGQASSSGMSWPFNKAGYFKVLPLVYLTIVAVFAVAVLFFGYALTTADIPGSLIAGAILAYLVHFVMMTSDRPAK